MDKKKVLIFSTAYYPFVGGAEVAVKEITDRLDGVFDFELITARMDSKLAPTEKVGAVTVYRLGGGRPRLDKLLLPFRGARLAYQLSSQKNYFCFWGIMVTFGSGAGYICNIFRKIFRKEKVPVVLTLQEGDSEEHLQYKWFGLIALSWKLALKNTDFLSAISNFLLNRAVQHGYTGGKSLVPNGVDIDVFSQRIPAERREKLLSLLGKKDDDIYLVTVSRLTKKNAIDDIISALTRLPENVSLIIIGRGEEGSRLQEQAESLGVASRVKFLGFIHNSDIPQYLSVCDIFIRPSRSEGFGNSFIEAMAAKLPVIATPVGGIPDFIDDKETGVFCMPDNPQSIVQAVLLVLHDAEVTIRIVRQGYDRVVSRYGWDKIAEDMRAEVFDKLAS